MEILDGIMDRQVLQRNSRDFCDVLVSGKCLTDGCIQMRVIKNGQTLKDLNSKTVAHVKKGKFFFNLRCIPVGGPYDITFELIDSKEDLFDQVHIKDVMVGDVWILGGQSNMEGIALLKDAATPDPMVRAFYMDDQWALARDPIHKLSDAVDQIHLDLENGTPCDRGKYIGTGPGVSFGKKMYELTGVPQGLICCAHGGTSMAVWDPDLKSKGSKSLYGAMFRRFVANGSNVAGIVWYQGESDTTADNAPLYAKRMKKFIQSVRCDFFNDKLPFAIVQLSKYYTYRYLCPQEQELIYREGWNSVQWQQIDLSKTVEQLSVVPAVDLSLKDPIHLDGVSQHRLGRRLADAMFVLKNGHKTGKGQIQPARIIAKVNKPIMNSWNIEISFNNIEECLSSQGKPAGFSLVDPNGNICDVIYRINIKGDKVILETALLASETHDLRLYYGYTMSPYCNITDTEDRSLPVFGPCEIQWGN